MRSDDEIMKLPLFILTNEEYARHGVLLAKAKAEAQAKQAYVHGKRDAHKDTLRADEGLREDLRVQAWLQAGNDQIGFDRSADAFTDVPEGWPQDVDGNEHINAWIDTQFETETPTPPQAEDTASVAAFNKAIGG